ncbi:MULTISPECIES: SDR family oxidoreductase UcpA [Acinetobacter]|uniref:SDR family oxidoreductase UcpA n=1 Tax=Acinetobacter TaxID=469 RepID=UPI0002AE91ED|nr:MULTISPECIES: SDR family oxidoreductase UcpA [Acinetobacter]ELW79746.1 KR domain protein [Acinetobacter sp. WC-743]MBI0395259.1 SDR family oxidoreductase UcpA [Acinetobacter bereziniae]MBJ8423316.1 SDR family oxidoreductase UcpA [Acinetobacter bereziniae]MBJ8426068.1 SDR family oxidoreductase UcpA [Acinetobacter bereziniae]MBJ8452114.1 SDR family oxidoreductase UcpA [Acinetobacter bereziniae]
MKKLQNKVAFITGASQGMGKSHASIYAKYGADLVLIDISDTVKIVAEELRQKYGIRVLAVKGNVTQPEEMKKIADQAQEYFGKIDILVCNAGVCRFAKFLESTDAELDFHIDVNIKGAWHTSRAVIPHMIQSGGGSIVVMSSITGDLTSDPGEVAYALSKAALIGFTKSLAVEMAKYHIRVNAICPGFVLTPMAQQIAEQSNPANPEQVLTDMAEAIPLQRLANPDEIGELSAFLASEESSYITGTQIVIDGACTITETVSVGI